MGANIELQEHWKLAKGPVLRNGIKPVHEAFADYMLMNPGCRLREMSTYFGYTVSWICTVINSDMFKAYFAGRRGDVVVSIAEDLPNRLAGAAHLATERIIEVIETTSDPELIIDAFDKVLHRHGFAPNAKGGAVTNNTQNNVFVLNKTDLQEARGLLLEAHKAKELPVEELEHVPVPTT